VRFGQSSRVYVLTGPTELMPQEGLNKPQRKQLALLEAAQARKEAEEAKARAQMDAAIARSGAGRRPRSAAGSGGGGDQGATWGMDTDGVSDDEYDNAAAAVDWRSYIERHSLTDKQQKLLDKIRCVAGTQMQAHTTAHCTAHVKVSAVAVCVCVCCSTPAWSAALLQGRVT
jgi:hypothetical protein